METKKFDEIRQYIEDNAKNKDTLWLIGERKWSLKLHRKILQAEKSGDKPGKRNETGIFLTKNLNWDKFEDDYADCTRLVFFNSAEQFQFIAKDNECKEYIYHHCDNLQNNRLELRNVVPKKDNNMKDNFNFRFAQDLGAIHKLNKNNKIKAIVDENKVDENKNEWRLWHE